mmetsp:Transcript_15434/g.41540  ORF Transcript_15434/g.41540 Transcript_15434/m.41540 type:complete len:100 (+) Transcript_15434:342-641(+)
MKAEFIELNGAVGEYLVNIMTHTSENVALLQEIEVNSRIQAQAAPTLAEHSFDCMQAEELFSIENFKCIPADADALISSNEIDFALNGGGMEPVDAFFS